MFIFGGRLSKIPTVFCPVRAVIHPLTSRVESNVAIGDLDLELQVGSGREQAYHNLLSPTRTIQHARCTRTPHTPPSPPPYLPQALNSYSTGPLVHLFFFFSIFIFIFHEKWKQATSEPNKQIGGDGRPHRKENLANAMETKRAFFEFEPIVEMIRDPSFIIRFFEGSVRVCACVPSLDWNEPKSRDGFGWMWFPTVQGKEKKGKREKKWARQGHRRALSLHHIPI